MTGRRVSTEGERTTLIGPAYSAFLAELKSRIISARGSAARAVNRDLILLYWDIGFAIVEKQRHLGWGDSIVQTLATDLRKAFPGAKGFSARNLWDMRRLFTAYSDPEILRHAVAELPRTGRQAKRTIIAARDVSKGPTATEFEFLR